MRWTSVWVALMLSFAILFSNASGDIRPKRSLSHIKRLLFPNVRVISQRNCIKKIPERGNTKEYVYVVPSRQNYVVETAPQFTNPIVTKTIKNNDASFILNALRQFLASDLFQQTSEVLRETVNTLITEALSPEETDSNTVDSTSEEPLRYISGYTLNVDSDQKSDLKVPNSVIVADIIHKRPLIPTPTVVEFRTPIISMPRKYSYEQIKDKTVQTYTLDNNSDVVVTETRRQLPRPAYIDDRIKEVILGFSTSERQGYTSKQDNITIKPVSPDADRKLDYKVNSDDTYKYTGKPIIVLDNASKISNQDTKLGLNVIEDERGDV